MIVANLLVREFHPTPIIPQDNIKIQPYPSSQPRVSVHVPVNSVVNKELLITECRETLDQFSVKRLQVT